MRTFLTTVLMVAFLVTSVVLVPGALAQTQPPKAPPGTQAPAPGGADKAAQQVEGTVKQVNASQKTVTLEDGTTLMVNDAAALKALKRGDKVKAAFEDKGGRKMTISIEKQ